MNEIVDFGSLKTYLSVTGTGDDTLLKAICTRASRIWDKLTQRQFYELSATHRFDFQHGYILHFYDQDLLSATTLTNGDGNALATYYEYPLRFYPKRWIELDQSGGDIFTYSTTPQRCIQVAGLWGFHTDYTNAWASSGDTVQNDPQIAAGATSITVADAGNFKVQQNIKIGSEQFYITATDEDTEILTVTPGINGTTEAIHLKDAAITIWTPDADVAHWVMRLSAWFYKQKDAPFEKTAFPDVGVVTVPAAMPPDIAAAAKQFRRVMI